MIHAELNILFHLPRDKIKYFYIHVFYFIWNMQTRAYESSIVLQLSPHLSTPTLNG